MKKTSFGIALVLVFIAAGAAMLLPRWARWLAGPSSPESPEAAIETWPERARGAARAMIEKYGRPSQFDREALAWFNNGIWKRTVVYRRGCPGTSEGGRDHVEQAIGYLAPRSRLAELERFSPRLEVSETAGEVSYCSESEATNNLAINIADEIATGRRTAGSGRALFIRTRRLAASGKSSLFREGLAFEADNTRMLTPTGGDR